MRRLSKQFDIWGKRFFSNGSLSQHSSLSLLLLHIQARTYFFWSININWAIVANWSVEKILHLELPPPWVAQIWQRIQDVIVWKENWNYWRICQKSSLQLRTGPLLTFKLRFKFVWLISSNLTKYEARVFWWSHIALHTRFPTCEKIFVDVFFLFPFCSSLFPQASVPTVA